MTRFSSYVLQYLNLAQQFLGKTPLDGESRPHTSSVSVTGSWRVLGPFQIGTREQPWGSDPLEGYGGFHALEWNEKDRYPSPLAVNGTVGWTTTQVKTAQDGNRLTADIDVSFEHIRWSHLEGSVGWAALQWQGWIRGSIVIDAEEPELLNFYIGGAVEYWIDDEHYFGGDFYNYARAPLTLRLEPGPHSIEIRLVRDVRAHGGNTSNPSVKVNLQVERTSSGLHRGSEVLLPDRLNDYKGPTAGNYGTVVLHNVAADDIFIHSIWGGRDKCNLQLVAATPIKIGPGQSRPIGFMVSCVPGTSASTAIDLHFQYSYEEDGSNQRSYFAWGLSRPPTSIYEPHRMTFLHPSGIVSYAILRPPPMSCNSSAQLPVLVMLHGAGLEADDDTAKHSLDGVADLCAWTVFPTGVTPWSGDDWHVWGWSDVEAAVQAIHEWVDLVDWAGSSVDTDRWLVTGHSNGGQGTWYAVTHHPERIIAAAPVSAYISIEDYVPYSFWYNWDSAKMGVIQAQLAKYRHQNLLGNAEDVPIMIQHGSDDDNVPVHHSRMMYSFGEGPSGSIREIDYNEVSGQGHWWDGVMVTPALSGFYSRHLLDAESAARRKRSVPTSKCDDVPGLKRFTIVDPDPGSTSSSHGLKMHYLTEPGRSGVLHVELYQNRCSILARHVSRFSMELSFYSQCQELIINDKPIDLQGVSNSSSATFFLSLSGWQLDISQYEPDCRRSSHLQGGLEAILQTRATFQIVQHSEGIQKTALEIANNLCQYYIADAELVSSYDRALTADGNIISIALGKDLPPANVDCDLECGIYFDERLLFVKNGQVKHAYGDKEAAAAIYLRPLGKDRLEMVIWANEAANLHLAARLFPIMTGSGQPDFIVIDQSMSFSGLKGVTAMGFWDEYWCPSPTSSFD